MSFKMMMLFVLILFVKKVWLDKKLQFDPNGYILYCPCMGRFGNQAEQFVGAIAFAKALNRSLVLPAWVTYPRNRPLSSQHIPFDDWFKVGPLEGYYKKVITMEYFMKSLAPTIWPVDKRLAFCYRFRDGKDHCSMKEGNPFGPFWNNYGVDFVKSVVHDGLLWDVNQNSIEEWKTRFPSSKYPVFAFAGVPGSFPCNPANEIVNRYMEFSDRISIIADEFIKKEMKGKKYVAIHLRNGIDIRRVCDDVGEKYQTLFASKQCTDHVKDHKLTKPMCSPPESDIVAKVKKYIKMSNAEALFIATDDDAMIKVFKKKLKRMKVSIHQRKGNGDVEDPIIDIALMSRADFFIGNCVSTFSSFVRRQRETRNLPFGFFGVDYYKLPRQKISDEL